MLRPLTPPPDQLRMSRRGVLVGAAAFVGSSTLAAACGSSADDPVATETETEPDPYVVVQRYPNTSLTPGEVRLAISIANAEGALAVAGPATLTGSILDAAGAMVSPVEAPRYGVGQAVPYWAVIATIDTAGIYYLDLDGAVGDPTPFQLFDPSEVAIPVIGAALPGFTTPTVADPRGVDPLCTRDGERCPFHEVTLTDALASGKPVVYLVGTPAHCETGTCAPGLEFLIEVSKRYGETATFVHAEVYADPEATVVAPAVTALALDYEPVIWVTNASGVVTERIDIVWDAAELAVLLDAALGSIS